MTSKTIAASGAVLVVASFAIVALVIRSTVRTERALPLLPKPIRIPSAKADLQHFIAAREHSRDPVIQDQVAAAHMRLAYTEAKRGHWNNARIGFTIASKLEGTGEMSAEWGTIPDQAAYQAAVCLVANHKDSQARSEFIRFLKERPLSPLVHACYSRLVRLDHGKHSQAYEELLQAAIAKQEARIRFETSVCGPKTIEYLLPRLGKPSISYKEIAKLCATTERGTTIEGMRKGLKAIGVTSYAYRLNRKDLDRIALPAILLEDDHYLALTSIRQSVMLLHDIRTKSEFEKQLPPADDPDFNVFAILFTPLEIQETTNP